MQVRNTFHTEANATFESDLGLRLQDKTIECKVYVCYSTYSKLVTNIWVLSGAVPPKHVQQVTDRKSC